ncbi:MAG: hypothetical protein Q4P66_08810 [Actinomycetaceae bacterium]|nr:hypothetical protein [Actinomycetaceae bacterium]
MKYQRLVILETPEDFSGINVSRSLDKTVFATPETLDLLPKDIDFEEGYPIITSLACLQSSPDKLFSHSNASYIEIPIYFNEDALTALVQACSQFNHSFAIVENNGRVGRIRIINNQKELELTDISPFLLNSPFASSLKAEHEFTQNDDDQTFTDSDTSSAASMQARINDLEDEKRVLIKELQRYQGKLKTWVRLYRRVKDSPVGPYIVPPIKKVRDFVRRASIR